MCWRMVCPFTVIVLSEVVLALRTSPVARSVVDSPLPVIIVVIVMDLLVTVARPTMPNVVVANPSAALASR